MRRPDVFTLDYSHPLAQGLVFAGMSGAASRLESLALNRKSLGINVNCSSWVFNEEIQRPALDLSFVSSQDPTISVGQLNVADGPNTLVFWSKHYGPAGPGAFVVLGQAGSAYWQHFSDIRVNVQTAAVNIPSTPVQSSSWRCWALVSNGSAQGAKAVFLNGTQIGSATVAGGSISAGGNWVYAGWNSAVNWRHNGLLADPLFYNRALSPAEIAILADRTDPMLGGLIVEERPVLYFDMGGSAGTDNLTASNLITGSPVLGTPALGQAHALTATGLTTSAPVLGTPALGQVHGLAASELVAGSPVLGTPAVGQVHSLVASALVVGSPVLGTPALNGSDIVLIDASEVGRATTLQARNYRATLAKRNYTARL